MSRPVEDLEFLKQQVLLACLRHHPNGYGVTIGDEIQRRTAREYSPGSVFLPRSSGWKGKAMSRRRKGEASAPSEVAAPRYTSPVTALGSNALEDAWRVVTAMRTDLEKFLELARWGPAHGPGGGGRIESRLERAGQRLTSA